MQRTGRKGHAMFRLVVQDAHRSPTSGKIVAYVGSYDPHTKQVSLDKEKIGFYLEHGAQPSPRVALILKAEKVKLPDWVAKPKQKKRAVRNPDKHRSSEPAPIAAPEAKEDEVAQPAEEAQPNEVAETSAEAEAPAEPAEENSAIEPVESVDVPDDSKAA
ncbi:MAG: 30S ribosomal protein S16 [Candidatus Saccharimonadales bacterium]